MKQNLILLFGACLLISCATDKKETEKKLPIIKAISTETAYKVDTEWYKGRWSIAPHVAHDTLEIICYKTRTPFKFKTDIDSIEFDVEVHKSTDFYVQLNDSTLAHTIITGVPFKTTIAKYDNTSNSDIEIKYHEGKSLYLEHLQKAYPLDVSNISSDTEKVLHVLNWTHNRWKHSGNNSPKKNDAISILQEAEEGGRFPCFAYAIVLRDQLNALGFKARTVYLKTKDAKTRKGSPGHVATEVYIDDLEKWVFVDGQFNVMPTLDGIPLNAIEFQEAITTNFDNFKLKSFGNADTVTSKINYVNFVYDYLYYIDTTLDNRYEADKQFTIDDKRSLMLVPSGAENLDYIDFWKMDVDYCKYTHSAKVFYAKPI